MNKTEEYNNLLEHIIRVLDERNDLERLTSICRGKITEERRASIQDVRSLFRELETNHWIGIDFIDVLKDILIQTANTDLFEEVRGFERRYARFEGRIGIRGIQCVDLDHPFLQMFSDPFSLFEIY